MEPMSDLKRRRNRRNVRLESLEGRCLLSVFKPAAVAAERVVVPGPSTPVSAVHGVLSGTFATDPFYGVTPRSFTSYSGHGTATPFGDVLVGLTFRPVAVTSPPNSLGAASGSILLTTVKGGNQLRLNFTGVNSLGSHNLEFWSWSGTVVSGSGRFINATGTFSATGSVPRSHLGKFNLDLKIILNPPV
jgi:hypothetical protein